MCQGKRQKHSFIYNFENSIHYYETNVLYVIYILLSLKNPKTNQLYFVYFLILLPSIQRSIYRKT